MTATTPSVPPSVDDVGCDCSGAGHEKEPEAASGQLVAQAERALPLAAGNAERQLLRPQNALEYAQLKRSWHGVEHPAFGGGAAPVAGVEAGRAGRAAAYAGEG